ncbi:VOC family protein [Methylobacterium oryzisoli]|uniref:VOC family protein n=1 Tax=Methylobacterium oryzisoli TaxID=3385502 RepID=UPI003892462D
MPHQPSRRAGDGPDTVLAQAPYRVGAVTLVARDLDALARFYQDVIGLARVSQQADTVRLGAGGRVLLVLRHDPAARPWTRREAGLFHTAFLLPGRGDLGAWLLHAEKHGVVLTGAADHLVSEAVYLDDPEGNGIEIYVDRPDDAWVWASDGTVVMRNERLDRAGIIAAATRPWDGMPAGGCIGHVHLQVGELDAAERFYAGLLGFAVTCRYPSAVFLGAGGYHHQLAGNIWNSPGAEVRDGGTTGLAEVELHAEAGTLDAVRTRCRDGGLLLVEDGEALLVRDPWGTRLRLTSMPG